MPLELDEVKIEFFSSQSFTYGYEY